MTTTKIQGKSNNQSQVKNRNGVTQKMGTERISLPGFELLKPTNEGQVQQIRDTSEMSPEARASTTSGSDASDEMLKNLQEAFGVEGVETQSSVSNPRFQEPRDTRPKDLRGPTTPEQRQEKSPRGPQAPRVEAFPRPKNIQSIQDIPTEKAAGTTKKSG